MDQGVGILKLLFWEEIPQKCQETRLFRGMAFCICAIQGKTDYFVPQLLPEANFKTSIPNRGSWSRSPEGGSGSIRFLRLVVVAVPDSAGFESRTGRNPKGNFLYCQYLRFG